MKRKFGELVREVKVGVDRANNPYEFYVAGDHMDSEDFRIHRKGCFATDDVGPAFIRLFRSGQVLYGSRRTYLKKVCVADFEGVTANTTFVLETKDENVLMQKLLPFLMLSDDFTDWSVKHSKGSTNPYVLFRDLANYEFDLPDPSRQKELVEILWAANDLKEKYKQAIAASDEMLKAKFREMFGDTALNSRDWPMPRFGDSLKDIENGKSFVCQSGPREGDFPAVLKLSAVTYGIYQPGENKAVNDISQYNPKTEVHAGDLLFTRKNTQELVGACAYVYDTPPRLMMPDIVFRLNTKACYDKQFLWALLSHPDQRKRIQSIAGGTNSSMVNISKERLCNLPMVVPPLALQQEFVSIARKADETKAALRKSIADVDAIIKGLING